MLFRRSFFLGWVAAVTLGRLAVADDSAASIAAGGLVPRRETRIVMAKEVLEIGIEKVEVDYDFLNESDDDVTTEVAFPVPPYESDFPDGRPLKAQQFKSFRLYVDAKAVPYAIEAKASLKDRDVTALLAASHIDIASFGNFDDSKPNSDPKIRDFDRLSAQEKRKIIAAGLISIDGGEETPNWTVHLQYHWTQRFPAHGTVHIRHEYEPVVGYQLMPRAVIARKLGIADGKQAKLGEFDRYDAEQLASFCPDDSFLHGILARFVGNSGDADYSSLLWVDFILTTANTWQRPIRDFTLTVERPKKKDDFSRAISLCSPGAVKRVDADHFEVHLQDFVPAKELRIGFFALPDTSSPENKAPSARKK